MSRIDLQYDARWWIPVDLDLEPGDWVPDVVRRRWDEERLPADEPRRAAVEQALTTMVDAVLDADPPAFLALLLHPRAGGAAVAAATLRIEDLDAPVTREAALDAVLVPAQMLEAPAEVSEVATRGGPAVRVLQRYRAPRDVDVETVTEVLAYLWLTTDDEGAPIVMTFSTATEDLVAAQELRPMFDEVAVTVAVVED